MRHVLGLDRAEMPMVDGGNVEDPQTLGERNN